MLPPPNRFPTAAFSRRRSAALLQMSEQIDKNISVALTFSPYVSLTFLPSVVTEFTEYKCQSVFRSAVPLGC